MLTYKGCVKSWKNACKNTARMLLIQTSNRCTLTSSRSAKTSTQYFLDFSLTVKASTLLFISGRGSPISSAKEGESGFMYNLVKS